MSTFRVYRRQRFTTIDQETVNDSSLSFKARGILLWLLDKPDDWTCRADAIERAGTEGREAIRSGMRELEAAGYLRRVKWQDEKGQWNTVVEVHERPPSYGNPSVGAPTPGSPDPLTKTETNDEDQPLKPPPLEIVDGRFDAFWAAYPRKTKKPVAKKTFDRLMRAFDHEEILEGLRPWVEYWDARGQPEYIPYPATFLNGHQWKDTPPSNGVKLSPGTAALKRMLEQERSAQ